MPNPNEHPDDYGTGAKAEQRQQGGLPAWNQPREANRAGERMDRANDPDHARLAAAPAAEALRADAATRGDGGDADLNGGDAGTADPNAGDARGAGIAAGSDALRRARDDSEAAAADRRVSGDPPTSTGTGLGGR